MCRAYLCSVANPASNGTFFLSDREKIFSEFITQNIGSAKLNTLSFSRMIHLITNRKDILDFLGIKFQNGTVEANVAELNRLLDVVSK
mgnify:CR=1 FL=1